MRETGLVVETGATRLTACSYPVMAVTLNQKLSEQDRDSARQSIRRELAFRERYNDKQYAAMRDRPKEALPVIEAELQQMHDKQVWHGVRMRDLTKQQRKAIIRSSMFLKDKYFASGHSKGSRPD